MVVAPLVRVRLKGANLVDTFVTFGAGGLVVVIALASLLCCKDDRLSINQDRSSKNRVGGV